MDNPTNTETNQQTPDMGHDAKLSAEAARRRVQAREASERADAAEREAAQLRAQIAELRLSQARQQVTAKHPELTAELIEKYAPANVDADTLGEWADKAAALVVALRGEAPVDPDAMTDTEKELAAAQMELARQRAVSEHEHVTDEVLDTLCTASTPEGVAEWAAAFERLAGGEKPEERKPVPHNNPNSPLGQMAADMYFHPASSSGSRPRNSGLQNVAERLTNR
ncbi:hypothetical protein CQR55_0148 [Bifidobacterium pseudolongum subsp. globosum]|uniref:hypothetical protein n=1 Tax=Bifidobacterium pseudolongum TaxID=1694 RepID=UPI000C708119|nr:hypothetical protein [Bifidobacterium pseudolongum]PKU98517.1 hypothetical protein CQR55_0148 [Bifidobacterium pseudolongum subsp. globosum]